MNLVRLKLLLFKFPKLERLYISLIHRSRTKDPSVFSPKFMGDDGDFVIEGFPRSGNTYFTYRFLLETNFKYKVAHHFHTPSQFNFSVKLNKKAIILIREPLSAITSYLVRFPDVSPRLAILMYKEFYTLTYDLIQESPSLFIVVEFNNAINGIAMEKVYKFLNIDSKFERQDVDNEMIFRAIEDRSAQLNGGLKENMVARPSADKLRDNAKVQFRSVLQTYKDELTECDGIYRLLISQT